MSSVLSTVQENPHIRAAAPEARIATTWIDYRPASARGEYRAQIGESRIDIFQDGVRTYTANFVRDGSWVHLDEPPIVGPSREWPRNLARETLFGLFPGCDLRTENGELGRSEFYQRRELWLGTEAAPAISESWTETAGRRHPVRPQPADGCLYRRYVPEIARTLSFRTIDPDRDLEVFHRWQNLPRVASLWDLAQPREQLAEYLARLRADPHSLPLILEIDGESAGYFEVYWVAEDRLGPYYASEPYDRAFHFLIGEKKFLGFENTDAVLRSVSHFLFLDDVRTQRIMAEPRADNTRVLRYVATLPGWRFLHEFDFPHKRAALLECRRETYFEEKPL